MEFTRQYLPMEWEERWRREKERRMRAIEEGREGIERDNHELKRIIAYNDLKMGLMSGRTEAGFTMSNDSPEGIGEHTSEEKFGDGEEDVQTYRSKTYPKEVFVALKDFWDSSLLTDLTLTTENGNTYHVHSIILAAVSGFILEKLMEKRAEYLGNDKDTHQGWSLHMDTEVDHVGLWAVMEFAYTGVVVSLRKDTMVHIKAAAQALVVPRLLDLCNREERILKGECSKEEAQKPTALDQVTLTFRAIQQLWSDRVGCDVILDVDGTFFQG